MTNSVRFPINEVAVVLNREQRIRAAADQHIKVRGHSRQQADQPRARQPPAHGALRGGRTNQALCQRIHGKHCAAVCRNLQRSRRIVQSGRVPIFPRLWLYPLQAPCFTDVPSFPNLPPAPITTGLIKFMKAGSLRQHSRNPVGQSTDARMNPSIDYFDQCA